MVNFGPLTAEIGSEIWGTPANFNGFRVLASLLQRRRSTEVNQTLHDVWSSPGLVHYIIHFGGSCPLTEFCQVQNSVCVQLLRSPVLTALLHGTRAMGVSQTLQRGSPLQGMELRNFRSSFSTEGATYIPRAAVTLGIGPHSSVMFLGGPHRSTAYVHAAYCYRRCSVVCLCVGLSRP